MKKTTKLTAVGLVLILFFSVAYTAHRSEVSFREDLEQQEITCDEGDALVCENLGKMYAKGQNVEQSQVRAREFFQKSCDRGNAELCEYLGKIYKTGDGVQKDFFKAFENHNKACQLSRANGCYNLGMLHSDGRGTRQSDSAAEEAFLQACELGGASISYLVGAFYSSKGQHSQHYFVKAKEYLQQGCDGKETTACNELGLQHERGLGVSPDRDVALEYYGKSCDLKNSLGCKKYAELKTSIKQS